MTSDDDVRLLGERVTLRPTSRDDASRLAAILAEPAVAERWGPFGDADVLELIEGDDAIAFAIEVDDEVVGAIQYGEETDEMYRHAGVDLFVATAWQRRGIGTDALRTLARYLIEERGHHRLTIDPAADNVAAITAYERVGFRRVGVMRRYERGPDGTWHDGLLMDLLAEELTE